MKPKAICSFCGGLLDNGWNVSAFKSSDEKLKFCSLYCISEYEKKHKTKINYLGCGLDGE